jgi:hypothetical protein
MYDRRLSMPTNMASPGSGAGGLYPSGSPYMMRRSVHGGSGTSTYEGSTRHLLGLEPGPHQRVIGGPYSAPIQPQQPGLDERGIYVPSHHHPHHPGALAVRRGSHQGSLYPPPQSRSPQMGGAPGPYSGVAGQASPTSYLSTGMGGDEHYHAQGYIGRATHSSSPHSGYLTPQ